MFSRLVASITEAIPGQCAVCRAWPAHPVCEACVVRFAQPRPRCRRCALSLPEGPSLCGACVRSPSPLDACVAAVPYAFPWSRIVVEFKFQGRAGWAGSLAQILRSTPWVEPALEQASLVLPMPLSSERLRERGFNQSLLLARHLAPHTLDPELLLRIRDTAPQSSLTRAERLRNVQHAFLVEPLRIGALAGAHVVLVDDVMTSGASLYAASAALKAAGAAHVTGLVLARAETGDAY